MRGDSNIVFKCTAEISGNGKAGVFACGMEIFVIKKERNDCKTDSDKREITDDGKTGVPLEYGAEVALAVVQTFGHYVQRKWVGKAVLDVMENFLRGRRERRGIDKMGGWSGGG